MDELRLAGATPGAAAHQVRWADLPRLTDRLAVAAAAPGRASGELAAGGAAAQVFGFKSVRTGAANTVRLGSIACHDCRGGCA